MPWKTTDPMSQRLEFVRAALHRRVSLRELCRQFGVSEKTGYKWLDRYALGGPAALADRSHAPITPAHQVPRAHVEAICALRRRHSTWGARKLRARLERKVPGVTWPAPSTITTLLKHAGLVTPRRRAGRERSGWAHATLTEPRSANDVWAADFKGEFRLRRGPYCYPLTVSDLYSRYVLGCRALPSTATGPAQSQFLRLFEHYGLPRVIRTDNGGPFSSPCALGGLSTLSVWWIRLGIRPERIAKGVPQQNGEHERMHRTLKAEATRPPAATLEGQQRLFDCWRRVFNHDRPHEALGQTSPSAHFTASPRPYPRRVPPLAYPAAAELRRVWSSGYVRWRGEALFLSAALAGEYVALTRVTDTAWAIRYCSLQLGIYDAEAMAFEEKVAWLPNPDE
jgi:putative transposase